MSHYPNVGTGSWCGTVVAVHLCQSRVLPPPPHGQVTTRAADLSPDDFAGCNWVFLSAYALYSEGLLQRAAELAVQVGPPCCG